MSNQADFGDGCSAMPSRPPSSAELENVKSFTRTNINKPDLPREKRVIRDIFGTSNLQNRTYGVSCDE